MSKVKTIQYYETDSEVMTFKKRDIEKNINELKIEISRLTQDTKDKGALSKQDKNKINFLTEKFNIMKAEKETIKTKYEDLQKQIEQLKKSQTVKTVDKFTGFEKIITKEQLDKEVDELYNKKYAKDFEDWKKQFE
jgi:hypothetical protein